MGRKKKNAPEDEPKEEEPKGKKKSVEYDSSDSEPYEEEPRHYDIDPDIQQLGYTYRIDDVLLDRLNTIMIEQRSKTWEQDIARLYEILQDAHTPAAMLNLKIRDMEKGTFVGKAKCGPRVKELCKKHRLDRGAATKLEEAMSMREAMGKDVEKDLLHLDEHLAASNKPSALVSMKLDSLRKGFNIGHCIYSREAPLPGNQAPGVDGVFDKRGPRALGYSDADLDRRFADHDRQSGGQLMDEATVRKMMAAERKRHEAYDEGPDEKASRSRSAKKGRKKGRSEKRGSRGQSEKKKSRSEKTKPKKKRSRSRSSSSTSRSRKKSRSRSRKRRRSKSRSKSRGRRKSPTPKKKARSRSESSDGKGKKDKKKKR
mmetsp:Transcript_116109/g.212856  ORF Transcript_116109/g.212856 Transcript_116109/m.212856 type:complete len:371 (+) Transcript_116109:49-1161(+)